MPDDCARPRPALPARRARFPGLERGRADAYARVGRLTRPPADSASGGQASRCRRGCGLGRSPGAWRPAGARMAVACVMSPLAPRPRVRSTRSLDRVPWCSPQSAPGSHRRPVRVREHPAARHWRGPVGYRNDATDGGRLAVVAGRGVEHPRRRRAGMEARRSEPVLRTVPEEAPIGHLPTVRSGGSRSCACMLLVSQLRKRRCVQRRCVTSSR
jgi:hypothetical protein